MLHNVAQLPQSVTLLAAEQTALSFEGVLDLYQRAEANQHTQNGSGKGLFS